MLSNFQLTFTWIVSIIVFSLCFALLLIFALTSTKLLSKVKYELLLICLAAPIMRLLIPMEVLPWTYNLNTARVLPKLTDYFHQSVLIGDKPVTRWQIVFELLMVISVVVLVCTIIAYWLYARKVEKCPKAEDEKFQRLINKILAEEGKKVDFTVRWVDFEDSPAVFGIFKPTILMPRIELEEKDLENVLRHEVAHYLHGDLVIRLGWLIIRAICCWNPAVYLLDGQLGKLLEIRADENATAKMSSDEQDAYMHTLIELAKDKPKKGSSPFNASFFEKRGLKIRKRMDIIMSRGEGSRTGVVLTNLVICTMVILLTVAMNCLILEPISEIPVDDASETTDVVEGNSFFIRNADGTFDLYFKGVHCATLEDTRGTDLPIYDSLEEAMKYEEIK